MSRTLIPGVAALVLPLALPCAIAVAAVLGGCGEPAPPATNPHADQRSAPAGTAHDQTQAEQQANRSQAHERAAQDNTEKTAAGNKSDYQGVAKPPAEPIQGAARSGAAAVDSAITDGTNTITSAVDRTTQRMTDAPPGSKPQAVDNSGQNRIDQNEASMTPIDQGNSEADLALTQAIRKAVIDDSSLSVNAHNIKIITRDGVVVLRGPVASQAELDAILAHARNAAGTARIDNQLAVANP